MIIPIHETAGQQGPTENLHGLDEMTRVFMGSRSQYASWRLYHLPGTPDFEYPHMKIERLDPADTDSGDIIKITVTYTGQSQGDGTGTVKQPEQSFTTAPISETITGEAKRTAELLKSFAVVLDFNSNYWVQNPRWENYEETKPGSFAVEYDTNRITFKYSRPNLVMDYQFEALANLALANKSIAFKSGRFVLDSAWDSLTSFRGTGTAPDGTDYIQPPFTYNDLPVFMNTDERNGIRNEKVTLPGSPDASSTKISKAGLNCTPRGLWYEVEESWEQRWKKP